MQMLLAKEAYIKMTLTMMSESYASELERLISWSNMSIVYISAFVGGIIGAFIGKAMLKKTF